MRDNNRDILLPFLLLLTIAGNGPATVLRLENGLAKQMPRLLWMNVMNQSNGRSCQIAMEKAEIGVEKGAVRTKNTIDSDLSNIFLTETLLLSGGATEFFAKHCCSGAEQQCFLPHTAVQELSNRVFRETLLLRTRAAEFSAKHCCSGSEQQCFSANTVAQELSSKVFPRKLLLSERATVF